MLGEAAELEHGISWARPRVIRFGAGNVGYLAAIGVAFVSAPASLLVSALVAAYYVFEHTPARPQEGAE